MGRRREAARLEKEKLALEIAILEAELERKRIHDAIRKLSKEMRYPSDGSPNHGRCRSAGAKSLSAFLQRSLVLDKSLQKAQDGTESTMASSDTTFGSCSWSGSVPRCDLVLEETSVQTDDFHDCGFVAEEESIYEEQTIDEDEDQSYEEWTISDEISCYDTEQTVGEEINQAKALVPVFSEIGVNEDGHVHDNDDVQSPKEESRFVCEVSKVVLRPLREQTVEDEADKDDEKAVYNPATPDSTIPEDPRKGLFVEAASVGRLTRLREHVIESLSVKADIDPDIVEWKSGGLLNFQKEPLHRQVFREAVEKGARTKLPEHVVCNYEANEDDNKELAVEKLFSRDDGRVNNMRSLFESGCLTSFETSNSSIGAFVDSERYQRRGSAPATTKGLPVFTLSRLRQQHSTETPVSYADLAQQTAAAAWDRRYHTKRQFRNRQERTRPLSHS